MRYVIIGGSAAGISAAEAIRFVDPTSEIQLFTWEHTPVYSRVLLSYYIAEILSKEQLHFRPLDFFKENRVTAHLGQKVEKISPETKSIRTEDGRDHPYDRLLIATGAWPNLMDIPGKEKKGVFVVRNLEHAQAMVRHLVKPTPVCILGGGLIGIRIGYALSLRGLKVKLIIASDRILSQMLDLEASTLVRERMQERGIDVITGRNAVKILGGEFVESIVLDNGEKIDCQMVVVGKGVEPNLEIVSSTSIKTAEGILADERMRTNLPDIYAAGDVAETYDLCWERTNVNALWPVAFEQGRVAGLNMAGRETKYEGSFRMNSLDVFGLPVISMGITRSEGPGYQEFRASGKEMYRKIVLKGGRLVGAILVGQVQKAGVLTMLMRKKLDVSGVVPFLLSKRLNFAELLPLVKQNQEKFTEVEYRELTQRFAASKA
ncbi:MAG: NAD(P)/FAD-dependent oxidoreductase [Syntrophaceae bacterium]|nr:NAD(P)/FAD-dependent oxidoreductase [Syntrophaceae bacterium]